MEDQRLVKIEVSIEIKTSKFSHEIERAIIKGIYRGLDTEPNYISSPKDVKIKNIKISN